MNKTRKIEMTVELIRILVAVGIAYAIALVTLFLISEDPVYIIQQFVLGPFSSVRRVGSSPRSANQLRPLHKRA